MTVAARSRAIPRPLPCGDRARTLALGLAELAAPARDQRAVVVAEFGHLGLSAQNFGQGV